MSRIFASAVLLLVTIFTAPAIAAERTVTLKTSEGNSQSFLLAENSGAIASVILFAGGSGLLNINEYGPGKGETNFLVRSRSRFVAHGFTVATVDASSAYQSYEDGLTGFRSSESHARDIEPVIRFLQKLNGRPVWLVGTSRGTISAANAAARLGPLRPKGIVLTASVTGTSRKRPETIYDVPLEKITGTVLLIGHKRDGCKVTPYEGNRQLKRKLKNATVVNILGVKGGSNVDSNPCRGLSYHGFHGIEEEVVGTIAKWISKHN